MKSKGGEFETIGEMLQQTADYLYTIEGDCSPEARKFIDTTRQIINEEFVHMGKTVSSQFLFDMIKPVIEDAERRGAARAAATFDATTFMRGARVEELEYILAHASGGGDWRRVIEQRISKWENDNGR